MGVRDELDGSDLGDSRLLSRLLRVAERLEADPGKSIAAAMPTIAEREGAYRLLANESVGLHEVIAPHLARSVERVRGAMGDVVVAHDTTEVGFSTPRKDLGRINDAELGRGFYLHTALAVSSDGRRDPLGVVGIQDYQRMTGPPKRKQKHTERVDESKKESARWWELVNEVALRCADPSTLVHVMDREADSYVLLARMLANSYRFVIRAQYDRRIQLDGAREPTLKTELRRLEGRMTCQVSIGPREPKALAKRAKSLLPPSRARTAILEYRAIRVVLRCPKPIPQTSFELPPTLEINVVHVVEPNPPEGYPPIEWKLYTSEPIDTVEQIVRIVDLYDHRWVIEEYFKALKTGCALEKRELESKQTILSCLGILIPIAWRILRVRSLARAPSDEPASTVLTPVQIKVLQRVDYVRMTRDNPTVRDAYIGIAKLGAHIKNNGPPGWQVLLRGYQKLLALAEGLSLALNTNDDYL